MQKVEGGKGSDFKIFLAVHVEHVKVDHGSIFDNKKKKGQRSSHVVE